MIGREIEGDYYRPDFSCSFLDEEAIVVKNLCFKDKLKDVSLTLHCGEILGIGGLADCGMHELGEAMFGALKPESGTVISLKGRQIKSPHNAMTDKIGYVSKDRDRKSLCLEASIKDNIAIAGMNIFKSGAGLIIVDIYENNAYDIQQELIRKYPEMDLVVLIASVRNTLRINNIFEEYKPDIVYHAAAHKHVPLMETSPGEAIKNNVFGTWKTAMAAAMNGTKKFVLISTDKAVNPTNVMGASKRICEMIVQTFNKHYDTEFVAVRFGNVLGSNGSVIPLFKKQIASGGPVTVTDPEIIRYFMTITEAVSLVLQAGAYAKGGEIFVLDMGEPVKILDLAENLIKLSGYKVGEDIKIEFTGLRPGEKLYEEMLMDEEGLQDTSNKMIHIGKPIDMDEMKFFSQLEKLNVAAREESPHIRELVKEIVETYNPDVHRYVMTRDRKEALEKTSELINSGAIQ